MNTILKPIVYDGLMRIRFSDLDTYGHLSASHYVDLVGSSRLLILEERSGLSLQKLLEKGIGFFLKRTVINYIKSVNGLVNIRQSSTVSKLNGSDIVVSFKVLSEDSKITHADGELNYVYINLQTGRPTAVPEWLLEYFFTK